MCRVTRTFARWTDEIVEVTVDGSDGPIVIRTTPEHPFYSLDHCGWAAASTLQGGSALLFAEGAGTVGDATRSSESQAVYNFEIAGAHTYYVTSASVLVHNACSHGQFVKTIRKQGYGPPRATKVPGGKMYRHPDGTRIRIHPRPNRAPHTGEPLEKFEGDYYYRVSGPNQGPWSAPVPLQGD